MQSDRRRLWEKAIRMDRRFMEALRRARVKRGCSNNRKGQRRRLLYYRGLFDGGDGTGKGWRGMKVLLARLSGRHLRRRARHGGGR